LILLGVEVLLASIMLGVSLWALRKWITSTLAKKITLPGSSPWQLDQEEE
jgi:hypothetical protein